MIHHLFHGVLVGCTLLLALACRSAGPATAAVEAPTGYQTAIRDTFGIYRDKTVAKDYDGIMDHIYPRLFDLIPREQMVAIFDALDSEEMAFDFLGMQIDSIGMPFEHEGMYYVLVHYNGQIALTLKGEIAQDEETLDMMVNIYKMNYGESAVMRERNSSRIEIDMRKTLFAIAPVGSQNWKFIENNEGDSAIMEQLLPQVVREHFGN